MPFFLIHGRKCTLPLTHFAVPPSQSPKRLDARDRCVQLGQRMTLYFLQHRLGVEVVQTTEDVACLPAVTRKHSKIFAPRYLGQYFIVESLWTRHVLYFWKALGTRTPRTGQTCKYTNTKTNTSMQIHKVGLNTVGPQYTLGILLRV